MKQNEFPPYQSWADDLGNILFSGKESNGT